MPAGRRKSSSSLADVVKASDEDLEWLYPGVDVLDSARRWLSLGGSEGPALVVVTRGAAGPVGHHRRR